MDAALAKKISTASSIRSLLPDPEALASAFQQCAVSLAPWRPCGSKFFSRQGLDLQYLSSHW